MSSSFFTDVRKLFDSLDINQDQLLDREEVRIGMAYCFEAVHRIQSNNNTDTMNNNNNDPDTDTSSTTTTANKDHTVTEQVNWLFAAVGTTQSTINYSEFSNCYHKLLESAYEEEVLQIDLNRAITALSNNTDYQLIRTLFNQLKLYYQRNHSIPIEELRILFTNITVNNNTNNTTNTVKLTSLGPKKCTAARKLVDSLLTSITSNTITIEQLFQTYKQLIIIGVPIQLLYQPAMQIINSSNNNSSSTTS